MRPLPSRGDIVRCLLDAGRGLHARELMTRCGVAEASYRGLLELLDQLSLDGSIRRLPGTRFKAQPIEDREAATWEGLLTVNPRGFGFVNAVGQEDVYIAPDGIVGAMHGDRVRVSVISRSSRGLEGRIEHIVERRNPRVAGVLRRRGRSAWLEPDDARVRGPIVVTAGAHNGKDGDAAVAVITKFPDFEGENPEAELVGVLGLPGDPNVEVAKILLREQIGEEHPEAALQEAEAIAARVQRVPAEGRVNLRDVPLPTIDPEDARDHDDAIWVERNGDGFRAWIAIADVSEYVTPGTAVDEEALVRGCSIYLPDRAIPMLPAALSADICSLLPEHDRLILCVIADLDKQGKVTDFDVVEGIMRSRAMLTYAGVARALGFDPEATRSPQADAMKRDLKVIDELARKLRRQRIRRGALDLDLPEAKVVLDDKTGAPVDVIQSKSSDGMKRAYQMVEELMLLANELVARFLSKHRAPAIYRVHGTPDEQKLERLATVAEQLGARVEVDTLLEPKGVSRFLLAVENHPRKNVLSMLLLRSLKQAQYDIANIGHFGLASDAYLHFTSPIRRYPDLEVHRIVKGVLRGNKPDTFDRRGGDAPRRGHHRQCPGASGRRRRARGRRSVPRDLHAGSGGGDLRGSGDGHRWRGDLRQSRTALRGRDDPTRFDGSRSLRGERGRAVGRGGSLGGPGRARRPGRARDRGRGDPEANRLRQAPVARRGARRAEAQPRSPTRRRARPRKGSTSCESSPGRPVRPPRASRYHPRTTRGRTRTTFGSRSQEAARWESAAVAALAATAAASNPGRAPPGSRCVPPR